MEMHKLLSSALESSAKNSEKFNVLKVKLVDSENLVAALTQKVNSPFIHFVTKNQTFCCTIYLFLILYLEF